jgi:glucan phosphoethanolaminetransferase (alkaline phosphatase superfamily)
VTKAFPSCDPHKSISKNRAQPSALLAQQWRARLRHRRYYQTAAIALLVCWVLLFDFAQRTSQLWTIARSNEIAFYLISVLESTIFWSVLLIGLARQHGRFRYLIGALFVVLFVISFGSQRYFHQLYATYANLDAALFGASFGSTLWKEIRNDWWGLVKAHLVPFVVALMMLWSVKTWLRPSRTTARWAQRLALPATALVFVLPCSYQSLQAATPDILYLHAMSGMLRASLFGTQKSLHVLPSERIPEHVPALVAQPKLPRNILFLLSESVRSDVHCSQYQEHCQVSPESNRLLPKRSPLLQLRANDSATAVSVAVLFAGVSPTSSHETMHSAPTLWELANAAGWDTAYWTSQHPKFGNSGLFLRNIKAKHRINATEIDPKADLDLGCEDRKLADYVVNDLQHLSEPFVAVVHYSNTHFPYGTDPNIQPFQPAEASKDPAKTQAFFNYYKNAVVLQDQAVARVIQAFRQHPSGQRTVILYTSDHGEAFREHGQLGHTNSIFEEEIHVPGWIDAPPGTLSTSERLALTHVQDQAVFHTDFLPTMADLLGIVDLKAIAPFRAHWVGSSLLRPLSSDRVVPITNCAAVWGCPFKNWGMMHGFLKLEARSWDPTWHCWDVRQDPSEHHNLGPVSCGTLPGQALRVFGGLPRSN